MWRYLFKLTIFLILIAGAGNYFFYLTTGRVPLKELWHRYSKMPTSIPRPSLPSIDLPPLPQLPGMSNSSVPKAFKWTDNNGVVHYSDQAPDGQNAKLIDMDPNQNLLESSSAPAAREPQTSKEKISEEKVPLNEESKQIDMNAIQKLLQGMRSAADQPQK